MPTDFKEPKKIEKIKVNNHNCYGIAGYTFIYTSWINQLNNLLLQNCQLNELPSEFSQLNIDKELTIVHSNLKEFPKQIKALKALEKLGYIGAGIEHPEALTKG